MAKMKPNAQISEFWVQIQLQGPKYWKVSPSGIEKCDTVSNDSAPIISFSENDFRFMFEKLPSRGNLRKHLLKETNSKCRFLTDKSDKLNKYVYATPVSELTDKEYKLYPGAFYIDTLIKQHGLLDGKNRVVGFNFYDHAENFTILVLYALYSNGELSRPEISLNPPELELVKKEFAKSNNTLLDDTVIFSQEDIYGLRVGEPYPVSDDIMGIPVPLIQKTILTISTASLLATGLFAGFETMQLKKITDEKQKLTSSNAKVRAQKAELLKTNLPALAALTSVNTDKLFDYSEKLYSDITSVSKAEANSSSSIILVKVSIDKNQDNHNSTLSSSLLNDLNEIEKEVKKDGLEELSQNRVTINGDNNGVEIEYSFKSMDRDYLRLISK